jgi:hypothetical protein
MKSAVLAKPNIKLFVLGALLMAGLGHLTGIGHSHAEGVVHARAFPGQMYSDDYLHQLMAQAAENTTPEICMQISAVFEQRGDTKRAIAFLKLANRIAEAY